VLKLGQQMICFGVTIVSLRKEKFMYLGITATNQNFIHEEMKSRSDSGNACHHYVQSILSSLLQPTYLKIKMYKTVI